VKEESEESDGCDLVPCVSPGRIKFTKEPHLNHSSSQIMAEKSFDDDSLVSEESIPKTPEAPIITIEKTSPIQSYLS
jgi:hypothetical protein